MLANAFKEGDLAVGGTADDQVRDEARRMLLATTVGQIRRTMLVDDGVSEWLSRHRDSRQDGALDALSVARIKELVTGADAAAWVRAHSSSLASEVIAAVVKVMSDEDLSGVARSLHHPLPGPGFAVGAEGHFGSRIQPNSPGDDPEEILFSILEGLSYGCGDVIIGLNPASDDLDTIIRLERLLEDVVTHLDLPTRYCVLSDIVKQDAARQRTRVDVGFQSLAGTSRALRGMVGLDADGLAELAGGFDGLYFETGQGSAVTNGTAENVDMVTLESRAYGLARAIREQRTQAGRRPWMIVNDVAGFIGPEVFRTAEQLERACLEDMVMAKLHGLTMGLDVCATFHMGIAPHALRDLASRIVSRAAPAYLMAVAGNADPMLGYLTTSFREHPQLRRHVRRRMASGMEQRLTLLGVDEADAAADAGLTTMARLFAWYSRQRGDRRSASELETHARQRVMTLRERGFDLGHATAADADARIDAIYTNARPALSATLSEQVLGAATLRRLEVRTLASTRDEYLSHPPRGEQLRRDDARRVASLYADGRPQIQLVVSDGLNATAVNEQLRLLLPVLRHHLRAAGHRVGDVDIVVHNGRVRVGYEIGGLVGAEVVVHVIGERPGTGLNTVSAYLTYGRGSDGQLRWSTALDHSATTAVCGIHRRGKPPATAAEEIARLVHLMLERKASGVALAQG